jgi:formylglycine-generating enzyme required for sulfatase activity
MRGPGPAHKARPFVDHDREDQVDRAAVEALLARSPLNSQLRTMMSEALDDELAARRATRQGVRAPGTRKEGPLGMALVWIPPGSFFMGSPTTEPCRDDDEFPHRVTLSAGVWMGAYPVTRAQWWRLMRTMPDDGPKDEHPVEGVSWHDANEFLDKLTWETLGLYRLPTEAEWEYACRAGTVTPFSFGFRLSSLQANFHATATADDELTAAPMEPPQGTMPVGRYPPNAWGLYDMHGNVMEWCQDGYAPYQVYDVYDPQGPEDAETKVLRGGGWWSPAHACRSARRSAARPDATVLPAGFRVVLLDRE